MFVVLTRCPHDGVHGVWVPGSYLGLTLVRPFFGKVTKPRGRVSRGMAGVGGGAALPLAGGALPGGAGLAHNPGLGDHPQRRREAARRPPGEVHCVLHHQQRRAELRPQPVRDG